MKIILRQPDDFHLHLREGELLKTVLPYSIRTFARCLIMPNLIEPIFNWQVAEAYKQTIMELSDAHQIPSDNFDPLMTIFITENTTEADFNFPKVFAGKLYFKGTTTNSNFGVSDIEKVYPLFAEMEQFGIPLSIHGEVADDDVDIFDRESVFIDRCLIPLVNRFPELRITFEHISTKKAVDFVKGKNSDFLGATITPHHLLLNRTTLLARQLRPHFYALPVVKREEDRLALVEVMKSGDKHFFLGTDSSPHYSNQKEGKFVDAGIFNTPYAIECIFKVGDPKVADDWKRIEKFTSENGAKFHGLPVNDKIITINTDAYHTGIKYLTFFTPDDCVLS